MTNVVIASEWANDISNSLCSQFPDVEFAAITDPADLPRQMKEFRPEIVFSIKSPAFPGKSHREILFCPNLRWLHVGGSGYDHLLPWPNENLVVTNCAGLLARHLAETVTGMMIALNLNSLKYFRQQQQRTWRSHSFTPLHEQTILVVGLGKIGTWVARNAKALGMRVLAVRKNAEASPCDAVDELFSVEQLHEVLGQADFVSLHVRLSDETFHLMDELAISRMKTGAFLINTSRGPVVSQCALTEALRSGKLAGAYLDVFETEPMQEDDPLWSLDNVIVTPHAADDVFGWQQIFTNLFCSNLKSWLGGGKLVNLVKP